MKPKHLKRDTSEPVFAPKAGASSLTALENAFGITDLVAPLKKSKRNENFNSARELPQTTGHKLPLIKKPTKLVPLPNGQSLTPRPPKASRRGVSVGSKEAVSMLTVSKISLQSLPPSGKVKLKPIPASARGKKRSESQN